MKTFAFIFWAVIISAGKCTCSERSSAIAVELSSIKDTLGLTDIKELLQEKKSLSELNFPNTTRRLYEARSFNFSWFNSWENQQSLWDAMITLDCVKHYGLDRERYHPGKVTYGVLKSILEDPKGNNWDLKVKTDILLTDAIISFMVHLHFGIENPYYTARDIDHNKFTGLKIDSILFLALQRDFERTMLSVQPQSRAYSELQENMRITVGQQAGDCDQTPEEAFKLMAINLERLRWHDNSDPVRIDINIPSNTLSFIIKENLNEFKITPGNSSNPTSSLMSRISSFTVAPEWAVPAEIFREEILPKIIKSHEYLLTNNYSIYNRRGKYLSPTAANLEKVFANPQKYRMYQSEGRSNPLGQVVFDMEDQQAFLYGSVESTPALHRYIGRIPQALMIERPELFLAQLLKAREVEDHILSTVSEAMPNYQKYTYTFIEPITIGIRYLTCEMKDGELVTYPDIYNLDRSLMNRLFKTTRFKT